MKTTKSLYIASAVLSAVSIASSASMAETGSYDASMKHCYGSALAGQNDCKGEPHSCKGQATANCAPTDWMMVMDKGDCSLLQKYCQTINRLQPPKKS